MPKSKATRPTKATAAKTAKAPERTAEFKMNADDNVTMREKYLTDANVTPVLKKVNMYLTTVFLIIWILIGIFVSLVISSGIRRGVYSQLFSATPTETAPPEGQAQTEVDLPGIGTVNIACVQSALSPESLQKVIQEKSTSVLQGEEKTKFEACITKPAASTSPSPAAQ